MTRIVRLQLKQIVAVIGLVSAAACAPSKPITDERLWTDDFEIRVSSEPLPPRAQEPTMYAIYVRDKKTREPIVNGEGRIFATNSDRHSTWNGFTYGPEVGTYHSRLKFITAGEWALGVQFRRDSTHALQQSLDWRQMVRPATPLGSDTSK
ncbi:MAG: hypothetical protein NTX19_06265 [Gemmatimonadetes bacterium]|jgi:hypothetical protein|nr:hypothetical protein [Gemmatimonadota bacterium]